MLTDLTVQSWKRLLSIDRGRRIVLEARTPPRTVGVPPAVRLEKNDCRIVLGWKICC